MRLCERCTTAICMRCLDNQQGKCMSVLGQLVRMLDLLMF